jgi:phosphomannomutase
MASEIRFGTDGWRAIIAKDFTFTNVARCAQGLVDYLKDTGIADRGLVVGYDTRFLSREFAEMVACVCAGNGIRAWLTQETAPTPVVSFSVLDKQAAGAAIITASHNPGIWNGFKFKPEYGGSASGEIVEELERHIANVEETGNVRTMNLREAERRGLFERFDPEPDYLNHIAQFVDLDSIRNAGLNVVVDSMYGSGAGYFDKLISGGSTRLVEIHSELNPAFPGMTQPEPIAHNLRGLVDALEDNTADIGLATDGDADRLGVIDDDGNFISTTETFSLLCMHLLEVLGQSGPLVKSITMSGMIDKLADLHDVEAIETPVGFKHLGPQMMATNALAAGEESGGYAFRGNIPERDGILSGLLMLDMMVRTGENPADLRMRLFERVGVHIYDRWDVEFDPSMREAITRRVSTSRPFDMAGRPVVGIDDRDGVKFLLEDGYWTLIRFSGTEPLLRIYAEGPSAADVAAMLGEARALTGV